MAGLNQFAIQIVASNVVLDLNGFNVQCSPDANVLDQAACIGDGGAIAPTYTTIRDGTVTFVESGPYSGPPPPNIIGVGFSASDRMTVEHLGIDLRRDSGFGSFASPVVANSIVRHNILSPDGVVKCPSIVAENASASASIGLSGGGC